MTIIFLFITGLCVGSFINVLVDRLPKEKDIIFTRSRCDFCRKNLSWKDLIPLLSFILLEGRCRYCRKKLSLQYPLIEILAGILFVVIFLFHIINNPQVSLFTVIHSLIIIAGLFSIAATDIKYMIIPDQILIFLIFTTLIYQLFTQPETLMTNLITGILAFASFLILVIITRGKGMGFGDVKLAFLMGFILGFPKIIVSLYLAFLTGALISLILILIGKKKLKSKIAFGPFLCMGTAVAYLYGEEIWLKIIGL